MGIDNEHDTFLGRVFEPLASLKTTIRGQSDFDLKKQCVIMISYLFDEFRIKSVGILLYLLGDLFHIQQTF